MSASSRPAVDAPAIRSLYEKQKAGSSHARSSVNPASYTTASDLGIEDPALVRQRAEAEARLHAGTAGRWQFVTPADGSNTTGDNLNDRDDTVSHEIKRPMYPTDPYRPDYKVGQRMKTAIGLGEVVDPGPLKIKLKASNRPTPASGPSPASTSSDGVKKEDIKVEDEGKLTRGRWTKSLSVVADSTSLDPDSEESRLLNDESKSKPAPESEDVSQAGSSAQPLPAAPSETAGLFKKRRVKK